jgi:glycosyltransferase involved in cell wall biosynthesis
MLIVSDDGVDYERLLAQQGIRDARLRFFDTGHSGAGPNLSRNIALNAASGEFIAPLDADDLFYPERLEWLLPPATGVCRNFQQFVASPRASLPLTEAD